MNTTANLPKKTSPVGTWSITTAKTIDETPYFGTVQIHQMGQIYSMSWLTTLGDYPGIAFFEDGHLYAGCSSGEAYGISLYHINNDGTLDGKWAAASNIGTVESEKAQGGTPGEIAGSYQVKGTIGKTRSYQGVLNIIPFGEIYQISWMVGGDYKGVGLLVDDKLIVAWGEGNVFSLHYQILGNRAYGQWGVREKSVMGTETLDRIC